LCDDGLRRAAQDRQPETTGDNHRLALLAGLAGLAGSGCAATVSCPQPGARRSSRRCLSGMGIMALGLLMYSRKTASSRPMVHPYFKTTSFVGSHGVRPRGRVLQKCRHVSDFPLRR
jgi:hypothetical protein